MMQRSYAGIGSRRTPLEICALMTETARLLAARYGLRCRSGGAARADQAFQNSALLWEPGLFDLFLPWDGYNGHQGAYARLYRPEPEAYEIAARYHPWWSSIKGEGVRHLLARNCHIALGPNLDSPVSFVVCWTPDGSIDGQGPDSGGTGHCLRVIAGEAPGTPVFNLAREDHYEWVQEFAYLQAVK